MNYAEKLIEKKYDVVQEIPYSTGYDSTTVIDVDDLVLAVLEEDRMIEEATSALNGESRIEAQRALRDSAFRELVQAVKEVKK